MNDEQEKQRREIALFRYSLIADLIHLPRGTPGLYTKLAEKAAVTYRIPGSDRTRVAVETIRDWLHDYQRGGFDALLPKLRTDCGRSRLPQFVADLLLNLKEQQRDLTISQVIKKARQLPDLPANQALPLSTVHRLLSRHGLMKKRPQDPTENDRRRFQFEKAGDLWMSDVMHGPAVVAEGKRKRKTYLIALIDDATRLIPQASFAFSEKTEAFLAVLKSALLRRGIPRRLFVDNGAAYRSLHVELVCAKLGITLIHSRPYHPQAKGKIERWFRTVRTQCLRILAPGDLDSIEALNRKLWAWIEGEYHASPHHGLDGDTPLDRWATTADQVRYPEPDLSLDDLFLFEVKRRVHKDRTVSLEGLAYEVDASLVDQTVQLRFEPAHRGRPIQVWFHGRYVHQAKPVDVYANCFVKRNRPSWILEPSQSQRAPKQGLRLSEITQDPADKEER
jgi:transposase InsO family protein